MQNKEIVIFNSNHIKSSDPVTYDDDGNVIPLSQRFNEENEDIRYSKKNLDTANKKAYNKRKKLYTDEFATNAMIWSRSAVTMVGEQNIFYRNGKWVLVEKTDDYFVELGAYYADQRTEILSEAHRLAVWWARDTQTESGDQTLIFMNGVCYLVECFDDALNYYQVEDVISKSDYTYYYEEITKNGKVGKIKSILAAPVRYDSDNRQYHTDKRRESSSDSLKTEHGRKSSTVVQLDREQVAGRGQSSSNGSGNSQSRGENRKKYSRELDSNGNTFTEAQAEFFKDTKPRQCISKIT